MSFQNLINNTNFKILSEKYYEVENLFNQRIISIDKQKSHLQHIKTIELNDSSLNPQFLIISNKKLFIINYNSYDEIKYSYLCINPYKNFKIEFKRNLDNFDSQYIYYFNYDKEKVCFYYYNYKTEKSNCYILNLKNGKKNIFDVNYKMLINLKNKNILGFSENRIAIINQNGEELLLFKDSKFYFKYCTLLSDNTLAFIKHINKEKCYLSFYDSEKLFEIKFFPLNFIKKLDNIKGIKNFNKKILLEYDIKIYILNYNCSIETVIDKIFNSRKAFSLSQLLVYDNNYYIDIWRNECFLMNIKTYKIINPSIPYILDNENNLIKNRYGHLDYHEDCLYDNYIFILYGDKIIVYTLSKFINY